MLKDPKIGDKIINLHCISQMFISGFDICTIKEINEKYIKTGDIVGMHPACSLSFPKDNDCLFQYSEKLQKMIEDRISEDKKRLPEFLKEISK